MFRKKQKNSRSFEPYYAIQRLKFSPSANHGGQHFFQTLLPPPPTIFVLLRPCMCSVIVNDIA